MPSTWASFWLSSSFSTASLYWPLYESPVSSRSSFSLAHLRVSFFLVFLFPPRRLPLHTVLHQLVPHPILSAIPPADRTPSRPTSPSLKGTEQTRTSYFRFGVAGRNCPFATPRPGAAVPFWPPDPGYPYPYPPSRLGLALTGRLPDPVYPSKRALRESRWWRFDAPNLLWVDKKNTPLALLLFSPRRRGLTVA